MPIRPSEAAPVDDAPLIVTAQLDDTSFAILDALRRRHFPASLNKVPAHVSLFHHLPGHEIERVVADLEQACNDGEAFDLEPDGVRFLGRGVALAYASHALFRLHADLSRAWAPWLTAQDRQPFRAHVTIQNKVRPEVARRLFESLACEEVPLCRVEGAAVWRYRGGPWEAVTVVPFGASGFSTA